MRKSLKKNDSKTGVNMNWLELSLISLVLWGLWGFFAKYALNILDWKQLFIISEIGVLIVVAAVFLYFKPPISLNQSFYIAATVGAIGVLGAIAFYLALSIGKASVVVPLTALYPLVTIVLSFLVLNERITLFQGLGIFFALVSIFLMSLNQ